VIVSRPLSIAEIFDRATTQIVRRWALLLRPAIGLALIGVLAALLFPSATAIRHGLLWWFLIALVRAVITVFAIAAFAVSVGAPDPVSYDDVRRVLTDGLWRFLRAALLYVFLMCVSFIPVVGAAAAGASLGPIAGVLAVVLVLPVVVLGFIVQVAFVDCVLEGTGATRSLMTAFERCWAPGRHWRTVLLAFAVGVAQFVPSWILGFIVGSLARLAHALLVVPALVALLSPIPWIIDLALVTIAALDYQLRAEGTDLDAELDLVAPT
jgi:hypothetical protein